MEAIYLGAFLGDALGAPYEFVRFNKHPWTGKLEFGTRHISRFQGERTIEAGRVTDDSEMTLALLHSINNNNGLYVDDDVIKSYLNWANSGNWCIGTNTRTLMRGVKTVGGFRKRLQKVLDTPIEARSQSNGCLMRATPLALFEDEAIWLTDCRLTNPHPVSEDAVRVYVMALRATLEKKTRTEILELMLTSAKTDEVRALFTEEERNVADKKGWCLHAIWLLIQTLKHFDCTSYIDVMKFIIADHPGSDTDTNACIVGGVVGGLIGLENLKEQQAENFKILMEKRATRPVEYQPCSIKI